jgi:hypothetical protein
MQILQSLIERSMGAGTSYPVLRSRAAFLQVAAELGIRVPATRTLTSEDELDAWRADSPAILKQDATWRGRCGYRPLASERPCGLSQALATRRRRSCMEALPN